MEAVDEFGPPGQVRIDQVAPAAAARRGLAYPVESPGRHLSRLGDPPGRPIEGQELEIEAERAVAIGVGGAADLAPKVQPPAAIGKLVQMAMSLRDDLVAAMAVEQHLDALGARRPVDAAGQRQARRQEGAFLFLQHPFEFGKGRIIADRDQRRVGLLLIEHGIDEGPLVHRRALLENQREGRQLWFPLGGVLQAGDTGDRGGNRGRRSASRRSTGFRACGCAPIAKTDGANSSAVSDRNGRADGSICQYRRSTTCCAVTVRL